METGLIVLGIVWYVVLLFSTICHEAAHAAVAARLGDTTAMREGHVTLDPVPHIRRSPVGLVIIPLLTFFLNKGGWMIGWASVPYDPQWAQRRPRDAAMMSLAGPATNLMLALLALLGLKIGLSAGVFSAPESIERLSDLVATGGAPPWNAVGTFLSILCGLNLVLALFNILPVPPLDGSGLPPLFLNKDTARNYQRLMWTPGYQLIGIVIAWNLFPFLWKPVFMLLLRVLHPGVQYGARAALQCALGAFT